MNNNNSREDNGPASGFLGDVLESEAYGREFTGWHQLSRSELSVVWTAQRYGRRWALKGLPDGDNASELHRRMLAKELDILMLLSHPMVVQAFSLENIIGRGPCIVMEMVDGVTLDQWLHGESRPSLKARRHIASLLIDTVEYVHSRGVIHRDLKPTNIIVTGDGSGLKLIDFGLADTVSHTVLKQPAGTPGYISPEQMEGSSSSQLDDIYSLGVVLGQMELGGGYNKVLKRCLAPATRRYNNVGELRQAMRRVNTLAARWRTTAIAGLLAALLTGGIWAGVTFLGPTTRDSDGTVAVIDSMQRQWEAQRDELRQSNDALRDSLRQAVNVNASLMERQQQQDARRAATDRAIAGARQAIDKAYAEANAILRDDKSQPRDRMRLIQRLRNQIHERLWEYLNGIKSRYDDGEMTEIIAAAQRYRADVTEPLQQEDQDLERKLSGSQHKMMDSLKRNVYHDE